MIISHQHQFIFLKTRKTGGTSVELALSQICGPRDVVTKLSTEEEERMRKGRHPQNFVIRLRRKWWRRWWPLRSREPVHFVFYNHVPAYLVRKHIGRDTWNKYRKVTIVRNPWDREVSRYYWASGDRGRYSSFEEYVTRYSRWKPIYNYEIHSIRGRNIADVILRHEHLAEDFASFVRSLGIADAPELPFAKSTQRPQEARQYRALYNERTRRIVARTYRREIEAFGYEF